MPKPKNKEEREQPDSLTDYENWVNTLAERAAGLKEEKDKEEA